MGCQLHNITDRGQWCKSGTVNVVLACKQMSTDAATNYLFVSQMAILYYLIVWVTTGAYKKAVIRNLPFAQILCWVVLQWLVK